jgi:hypothetical protein
VVANAKRRDTSYLIVAMMIAMAVNLFSRLRSAKHFPELPKMPAARGVNMETREVVAITAALMFPLAAVIILPLILRR